MLALWSPYQLIMKKPSRHQFRHIITHTTHSVKENGEDFFRMKHLPFASERSEQDQLVKIEFTQNSISKGQVLSFAFYKMEQKPDEQYQAELEEYNLQKKREETKEAFIQATTAFNLVNKEIGQDDYKLEELRVAKKRLAKFVDNEGIPLRKKLGLVDKWTKIVQGLEKSVKPVSPDLLEMKERLATLVTSLQQSLELQNQILNFKSEDYEGPDCPSDKCCCMECRHEFSGPESSDDDPDYSDPDE